MRRPSLRSAAVLVVLLALFGLAACQDPTAGATPALRATPNGTASSSASASASANVVKTLDGIKVAGARLTSPKITFDVPLTIDKTRSTVLVKGAGPKIVDDGFVTFWYYGVDGRTGKKFDENYSAKQTATVSLQQVVPGFTKGLTGKRVGSRVLIAMPGSDGYDSQGGNAQAGIEVGDTLVFVVDIVDAQLAGPSGSSVKPPAGLPTVSTNAKNVPSIAVPAGLKAPSNLVVQTLIQGQGTAVGKTDAVTTNYLGVDFATGKTVFNTYPDGPNTSLVTNTIPGLTKALVGQKVGSRVLVIVPPEQGYPNGLATPSISKGVTMVFVVDVLFTQAGS